MHTQEVLKNPFHILLVEDNLDHAELTSRSLDSLETPTHIQHLTNGKDALDYLFHRGQFTGRAETALPDLVLLDLRLQQIDGLEVLRQIKIAPEIRGIPVVVLTTSDSPEDIKRAYEYYANSYLVKPYAFKELSEMLRHCCVYWRRYNQLVHGHTDSTR